MSVGGALQVNDDVYTTGVHIGRPHAMRSGFCGGCN